MVYLFPFPLPSKLARFLLRGPLGLVPNCARRTTTTIVPPARSFLSFGELPGWCPTARGFLTRPPTGTPRRAINPGEGLPILYMSL